MNGGRPQVSIRLGTSGKSGVQQDFTDIADHGGAQAARLRAKWESETAQIERLTERQAKTAERLAAVSSTPVQQRINAATGTGASATGSAAASAKVLAAELDRAEREATQLIAAIDPLFGAQQRYAQNVGRINDLKRLGVLEGTRYAQLLEAEEQALDSATQAALRNNQISGLRRAGMQQLSFQAGDVAQQLALGTSAGVVFAQQSGQVIQAMQMMGGEGNKFVRFLGSGWGMAVGLAAVVLLPLIGNLLKTEEGVDSLTGKLSKQAREAENQEAANKIWANSIDGVTNALRDNRKALDDIDDAGKTAARRALETAIAESIRAKAIAETTVKLLEQARAQTALSGATITGGTSGAMMARNANAAQIAGLEARLAEARTAVTEADGQLQEALGRRLAEIFSEDPVEKIKRQYDDPRTGLIALAAKRASAEEKLNGTLKERVELLKAERDAKVKAEEKKDDKPAKNAGGTAIFDAQIGAFFDTANKYKGLSETRNKGVLEAFFREANMTLDPEKTAWCAAFVNAVLATNGVKGSGSLLAGSFMNYGKDDTKSPQKGDIVVVKSSASASGQHVGFLESVDAQGNVRVLGGNTSDKVASATYSKKEVLAIRRPPTPSEAAKSSDTAADRELKAQNDFEEQVARLRAQVLQAEGDLVVGTQARAALALQQVTTEENRAKLAIQNDLEEGKFGEATSQLATERAKQLTEAVEQTAAAKRTTLSLQAYARLLSETDQAQTQAAQFQLDDLQHRESIARTAGEQRKLGLQIVDMMFDEKKRHLEYQLALAQLAGETAEAARIQAEINNLPKERAREEGDVRDSTKSPGEAYLDSLPKSMAELGAKIEESSVDWLKDLNSGLREAIMNADSFKDLWGDLGEVAHNIAKRMLSDLLDLAIQMFIMRPLAEALFGAGAGGGAGTGGGGGGGGSWISTAISGIASIAGAVFGGGSPGLGGGASNYGANPTTGPIGMAVGSPNFAGGVAWVGENGKELVELPRGSKVNTAAQSRQLMAANDSGPRVNLTNYNDFRGADASAVAGIKQRLDQMEADLPSRAVQAMQDAKQRFVWR